MSRQEQVLQVKPGLEFLLASLKQSSEQKKREESRPDFASSPTAPTELFLSEECSFAERAERLWNWLNFKRPEYKSRVPNLKMNYPQSEEEEKVLNDELECKICYQKFNVHSRKPKILDCLHRVCAKCLAKILHMGDGFLCIICPFCRHETELPEEEVEGLPDDTNVMSKLMSKDKTAWSSDCTEVVLTPKNLASSSPSRGSSSCLVITIMEVQRDSTRTPSQNTLSDYYTDHSPDSASVNSHSHLEQDIFSKLCNHVPRILVWLLGVFYFGSLPLGIYLLVIQRVTLGIVCVSLVPSSLTACLVYGFCQCLCQGMCDCSSRN